ncbi:hypothetical protein [Nocardia seriolae]|nr:hypothetical protein [Nocardia seriolae]
MAELAAMTDVSDLPQAVAAGLGVAMSRAHEPSGADPVASLAEALPTAPALLILDNCEHLVDGVARFAEDLLGRVPEPLAPAFALHSLLAKAAASPAAWARLTLLGRAWMGQPNWPGR